MDELCEITSSKRIFAADYVSEGVPFYRGREITEKYKGNLDVTTELFITEEKFTEIERKFGAPKPGDLLLTSVGTLGSVYVVKPGDRFYFKDGNLTWFRQFQELDSRFLYYWLGSPQGKAELQKATIGSSQSALTIVLLKGMEMELPPLPVQRRLAGILAAYDELMENSQRRVRILEAMARALYREWFVHFRFPGHEKLPRVASPLGDIPQGWEVKSIQQFGAVITGKTPSKANADFYGNDMPFVKTPDMHGNMFILGASDCLSTTGAESQANKTLPAGSICVSCIGTIGVVSITTEDCQTNQQINSVVLANPASREFLFLRLQDAKQTLENLGANGATMGNVNKGKFEAMEIICPPDDLLASYHRLVEPMFSEILSLFRQIQNLRRTRDLLLPRLLCGELRVSVPPPTESVT
jgi:type I restriction enzyme S subunit